MTPAEIAGHAATAGAPIAFMLLAWLRPYRPQQTNQVPFAELQRRYGLWQASTALPIAGFTALFAFFWYGILGDLHASVVSRLPPARFVLVPVHYYWLLLAFLLGMISSAAPVHLLYSLLLGGRYAEFTHYGNLSAGFDTRWLTRRLSFEILLLVCIGSAAGLDYYTAFTDDRLLSNELCSFGLEEHRYADIREIRSIKTFRAPSGDLVPRPYFQVVFTDGYRWTSREGLHGEDPATDRAILEFLSRKSGNPVVAYDIVPD